MTRRILAGLSTLMLVLGTGAVCVSVQAESSSKALLLQTETAPVMDGVIDDVWRDAPTYALPHTDYYYFTGGDQSYEEADKVNHIANSYFKLLWDADHIYFLVDAKDTSKHDGGADAISIFFRELDVDQSGSQMLQISFNREPNKEGKFESQIAYENTKVEYAVGENDDGYVMEWILERERGSATVKKEGYAAGDRFQANVTIDDDIDGADWENWKGQRMKMREYQVSYLPYPKFDAQNKLESGYVCSYNPNADKSKLPGFDLVDTNGEGENIQPSEPESSAEVSSKPPAVTTLPRVGYGSPDIDGQVDAVWNTVPKFYLNELMLSEGVTYPNGCEGSYFQMLWDEDQLYLLVQITDSTKFAADEISFYFREQNLPEGEVNAEVIPGKTCHIIHAGAKRQATEIILKDAPGVTAGTTIPCVTAEKADGWLLECSIPRERGEYTGMPDRYQEGHEIQMNVAYQDDIDGEEIYLYKLDDYVPWREYQVSWAKPAAEGGMLEEGTYRWWLMPRSLPALYLTKEDLSHTESSSSSPSGSSSDSADSEPVSSADTGRPFACGVLTAAVFSGLLLILLRKKAGISPA